MHNDVIYHGDCIKRLKTVPDGVATLVATDPPFNIGLKYDLYEDKVDYKTYIAWCKSWISECYRVLAPNGSIYVSIGDEYQAEINILLKEAGFFFRNTIVWYYTFGENQRNKFNRCHTMIHYFSKSATDFKFNADAVKVPSKRQLMGDKRAKAGGKCPDDVWESLSNGNPTPSALIDNQWDGTVEESIANMPMIQRLGEAVGIPDDVWKISRVCGTFKERLLKKDGSAHPCQQPQSTFERMLRASSDEGDLVIDPFCGTGTCGFVAHEMNRRFITMDLSEEYCRVAAERIFGDEERYLRDQII